VMRSDWTRDAMYMVVNHGPAAPTHTHADLLSFEAYAFGQALAVDAGIGMSYDDSLYVPWYQSSRAHNMVVLNDRNMERENTTAENVQWIPMQSVEYLAGSQPGYVSRGLHQRRHILYMKSRYWFIMDDLRSTTTGDTLSWYFHSPTTLQKLGRGYSSVTGPGISILPAVAFDRREGSGWAAATNVTSPGAVEKINWIRFDQITQSGKTCRFPVLLLPFRTSTPSVKVSENSPGSYEVVDGDRTDRFFFAGDQSMTGEVRTDAAVLILSDPGRGDDTYTLIDGTFFEVAGKTIFRSPSRTSAEGEWSP
jgi:hypothetical protein